MASVDSFLRKLDGARRSKSRGRLKRHVRIGGVLLILREGT